MVELVRGLVVEGFWGGAGRVSECGYVEAERGGLRVRGRPVAR